MPSSRLDALFTQLADLETDELAVINNCIELYSGNFTKDQFKNWSLGGEIGAMINRCFKFDTIEEIFAALKNEMSSSNSKVADFAATNYKILQEASPTSLKVTLSQLRKGAKLDIARCLKMEYRMVQQFLNSPDFSEGVTAKLIEKRSPVWRPSIEELSSIKVEEIESKYFKANGTSLNLLNRLSFYDYPSRTLSGLPTDRDIQRVVMGEGRRNAVTAKPQSRKDALEWILRNWGRYDSGAIGELSIPTKLTLDGGFGRGKSGLKEKVEVILEENTTETAHGLEWLTR